MVLDTAAMERLNNYHHAQELFVQNPIFGVGIGGFNYWTGIFFVHNLLLEIACELGFVGLVGLAIYVTVFIATGLKVATGEHGMAVL